MKIAGIAATITGIYLLSVTALPLLGSFLRELDLLGLIFMLSIGLLMTLPGALLVWFGARLFLYQNVRDAKGIAGTIAVLAAFILSIGLKAWLPWSEALERDLDMVSLLLAVLLVLPMYMVVAHALLKRAGMETHGHRGLVSRGALFLIAWLVFLSGFEFSRLLFEPHIRADAPGGILTPLAALLLPIAVAWLFFRVATRQLLLPRTEDGPLENAIKLR